MADRDEGDAGSPGEVCWPKLPIGSLGISALGELETTTRGGAGDVFSVAYPPGLRSGVEVVVLVADDELVTLADLAPPLAFDAAESLESLLGAGADGVPEVVLDPEVLGRLVEGEEDDPFFSFSLSLLLLESKPDLALESC